MTVKECVRWRRREEKRAVNCENKKKRERESEKERGAGEEERKRGGRRAGGERRVASRHSKLGPWEREEARRERRQSVLNCLSTRRPVASARGLPYHAGLDCSSRSLPQLYVPRFFSFRFPAPSLFLPLPLSLSLSLCWIKQLSRIVRSDSRDGTREIVSKSRSIISFKLLIQRGKLGNF